MVSVFITFISIYRSLSWLNPDRYIFLIHVITLWIFKLFQKFSWLFKWISKYYLNQKLILLTMGFHKTKDMITVSNIAITVWLRTYEKMELSYRKIILKFQIIFILDWKYISLKIQSYLRPFKSFPINVLRTKKW